MRRILIVKCGSTHPRIRPVFGDYDRWFREALGGAPARFLTVSPFDGEALPSLAEVRGILLTGSPASVRDESPWMADVSRYVREANEEEIPVLGVCFGHQLLGEALGGRVEKSPGGWEFGTVPIELTAAGSGDPLFEDIPARFHAHTIHQDELASPPPGAVRLAGNAHSAWQAFAFGPRIRAVQFHLEISPSILEALADALGRRISVRETDVGERILANWLRHFLGEAA